MTTPPNPLDLAVQQLKAAEDAKLAAEAAIQAAKQAAAEAAEEQIEVIQKGMKARQKDFQKLVQNHQSEIADLDKKIQQLNSLLQPETSTVVIPPTPVPPATSELPTSSDDEEDSSEVGTGYDYKTIMAIVVILAGGLYLLIA